MSVDGEAASAIILIYQFIIWNLKGNKVVLEPRPIPNIGQRWVWGSPNPPVDIVVGVLKVASRQSIVWLQRSGTRLRWKKWELWLMPHPSLRLAVDGRPQQGPLEHKLKSTGGFLQMYYLEDSTVVVTQSFRGPSPQDRRHSQLKIATVYVIPSVC